MLWLALSHDQTHNQVKKKINEKEEKIDAKISQESRIRTYWYPRIFFGKAWLSPDSYEFDWNIEIPV